MATGRMTPTPTMETPAMPTREGILFTDTTPLTTRHLRPPDPWVQSTHTGVPAEVALMDIGSQTREQTNVHAGRQRLWKFITTAWSDLE